MRFLKENFHDVVKLFINQVGVSIFSFFLYTSVGTTDDGSANTGVNVGISIVSILFFAFLLYTVAWDLGAKDKIRVDSGRVQKFKFKGALIALYANTINFIFAAVAAISILIYMLNWPSGELFNPAFEITFKLAPDNFALDLHSAFNILMRALSLLYNGLIRGIFSWSGNAFFVSLCESVCFFVTPAIGILATHFGYRMGLSERKIFSLNKNAKK